MAAIGEGWVDGAWVQAAWVTSGNGAWAQAAAASDDFDLRFRDGTYRRRYAGWGAAAISLMLSGCLWVSPFEYDEPTEPCVPVIWMTLDEAQDTLTQDSVTYEGDCDQP